jgi:hypothetical protein
VFVAPLELSGYPLWINSKWAEYVVLFGTSSERVALLNEASPSFAHLLQDALWENVLLHIARLTDPAMSCGKTNLSLAALAAAIDRPATRAKAEAKVQVALSSSKFARDWRNRHIAHKDLHLALEKGSTPLAVASRNLVAQALTDLGAMLNVVSQEYVASTSFFDGGPEVGGAIDMLYALNEGLLARRARRERLERGEYKPEDFERAIL